MYFIISENAKSVQLLAIKFWSANMNTAKDMVMYLIFYRDDKNEYLFQFRKKQIISRSKPLSVKERGENSITVIVIINPLWNVIYRKSLYFENSQQD